MNKRARWTILDVSEELIKLAKKYAKKHGYTMGKAMDEIIKKGTQE